MCTQHTRQPGSIRTSSAPAGARGAAVNAIPHRAANAFRLKAEKPPSPGPLPPVLVGLGGGGCVLAPFDEAGAKLVRRPATRRGGARRQEAAGAVVLPRPHNPPRGRGIETPGWLLYCRLSVDGIRVSERQWASLRPLVARKQER
jgi:hypothetical protein